MHRRYAHVDFKQEISLAVASDILRILARANHIAANPTLTAPPLVDCARETTV
jgi:hypothetical protein